MPCVTFLRNMEGLAAVDVVGLSFLVVYVGLSTAAIGIVTTLLRMMSGEKCNTNIDWQSTISFIIKCHNSLGVKCICIFQVTSTLLGVSGNLACPDEVEPSH